MARRHGGKNSKSRSQPRGVNPKDARIKRWNRAEDIPMNGEDEFHAARDQILLDGEDLRSDDEGDEEEVFALKGIPSDSEGEDEDEDEGEEEDPDDIHPEPGPSVVRQKKGKQTSKVAASSDEESELDEEEEAWGKSKAAYYSSNAAELDSEDEEANEMEEQEARRLQAKARDVMADNDFGLEDFMEGEPGAEEEFTELAAPVVQKIPEDKGARLRHLEKTSPEALALAGDWDDAARALIKTQAKVAILESEDLLDKISTGMLHLYYQALLQYATTLAFYLYLRASAKYAQHPELLRAHPIMKRLLTFKQSIATLEELGVNDDNDDEDDDDLDLEDEDDLGLAGRIRSISAEELRMLLADMEAVASTSRPRKSDETRIEKPKKTTKEAAPEQPPKKRRKTASDSGAKATLPVFDLEEPEFPAKPKVSSRASRTVDTDAYGEPIALQAVDALDKAARKKSLRFHTAKIESASARRERARAAASGDDDIPWKERKREKELRNKKEVEKTRGIGGADLDDEEPELRPAPGKKRRRDEDGSGSGDEAEGYYDLVQRKSKEKKEKKKDEYEAAVAMAKEGMITNETAEGPRGVSRAILKNKGLTPHRSKSVRNPRVKKRQRYEQAKKKIASQKAVYKGGLAATGRYDGEKSGITKVIKSVKL